MTRPMEITIIGSGAIGGTLGAHMIRAGHDITLCDADAAHIAAIRERGLIIEGPVDEFTVAAHAVTPDELPDRISRAIVAVKSLHTGAAAELLRDRLAPDGYVLTVQNGLTAHTLIEAVGRDRVISSFVNFGADVMAPGRIMQGNVGTFRVGELEGGLDHPARAGSRRGASVRGAHGQRARLPVGQGGLRCHVVGRRRLRSDHRRAP